MKADLPANESARLEALRNYGILDTVPEPSYDDIAQLAAEICDAPIALVSIIDSDRQWFKSKKGLDISETSRDVAICAHAILQPDLLIIADTRKDKRFADNPWVTQAPHICFYAGAPLITSTGEALGTLCVMDKAPRALTEAQKSALRALSRQVMAQLELRRHVAELERAAAEQERYQQLLEEYQRKLEEVNTELEAESVTDELTELNNRRAFQIRMDEEFERTKRYKKPLSLMLVVVDQFKEYDDSFGHQAADEVLRSVAHLIRGKTRMSDYVARYGGEQFAIILPDTDSEGALIMAERLRKAVEEAQWQLRPVTVSIGTATMNAGTKNYLALITEADKALYHAEESGRNRVSQASGSVSQETPSVGTKEES